MTVWRMSENDPERRARRLRAEFDGQLVHVSRGGSPFMVCNPVDFADLVGLKLGFSREPLDAMLGPDAFCDSIERDP